MKSIITILATAAVLTVAIAASGFAFDGAVILSIAAAASLVGMFVSDYSRIPNYNLETEQALARTRKHSRHAEAGVEFATFATFNTMVS